MHLRQSSDISPVLLPALLPAHFVPHAARQVCFESRPAACRRLGLREGDFSSRLLKWLSSMPSNQTVLRGYDKIEGTSRHGVTRLLGDDALEAKHTVAHVSLCR